MGTEKLKAILPFVSIFVATTSNLAKLGVCPMFATAYGFALLNSANKVLTIAYFLAF